MTTSRPRQTPEFPHPKRGFDCGEHPFLQILPDALESPAFALICSANVSSLELVQRTVVRIVPEEGFCWVDDAVPCIVLARPYYETGSDLDLYLDLLHELTHVRQVLEGIDVWDERYPYHRRPTEIEGYAVAVSEARRLGLTRREIIEHLTNPWMTAHQVSELYEQIMQYLREKRT